MRFTIGPMPDLQWGHRLSAMETAALRSPRQSPRPAFNGATAFRRWKRWAASQWNSPFGWLQWGHRLSAMETPRGLPEPGLSTPCFNGATAFQRWKHRAGRPRCGREYPASMGPPPFGDGNAACLFIIIGKAWLQWGHRLSAMETWIISGIGTPSPWLQWGHRLSAMEATALSACWTVRWSLQWGHRLSAMETTTADGYTMGDRIPLQWGHRLSAMETAICESLPSYFNVKVRIPTRND